MRVLGLWPPRVRADGRVGTRMTVVLDAPVGTAAHPYSADPPPLCAVVGEPWAGIARTCGC